MPNEQAQSSITISTGVSVFLDKTSAEKTAKELSKTIEKQSSEALKNALKLHHQAVWGGMSELDKQRYRQRQYEKLFPPDPTSKQSELISKQLQEQSSLMKDFTPTSLPKTSAWDTMRNALSQSISKVQEFNKELQNSVGLKLFKGTIQSIGSSLTSFKDKIKQVLKPLNGFFSAIKRIAIYRAIRAALKEIVKGFEEGRQNAYQWSVVTGNQFARSMDMMATSALYLKNSLGAMTMPLTNYLAPILDRLVDQFVELINMVNRFTATITGASSWVKALKYPAEYMEQAAGSAKELKNQLLGFDDLNVLNAPSGSGSASAMDYSKMFEQVELNMSNMSFTKALQDAIKNSDWVRVGEVLSEQLNMMVESIDAKKISKWLGDKLNNAIRLVHTLLRQIDFQQIGFKIGEFISNLQLDWGKIAEGWVRWKTNIADTLLGLIQGINWGNVGHALGEFIKGLFNGISDWLAEVDWAKLASDVTRGFFDLIGSIDWNGVFRSFYNALWGILNSVWQGISSAWRTLIRLFTGELSISDLLNGIHHSGASEYNGIHISVGGNTFASGGGRGFADGGFPEQGTMFYAGEAGAEVVAQIGGRTGVYNADQMTGALATANEGVVSTLTAVGNAIVGAINRKDMSISTSDMRNAINKMNVRYGV